MVTLGLSYVWGKTYGKKCSKDNRWNEQIHANVYEPKDGLFVQTSSNPSRVRSHIIVLQFCSDTDRVGMLQYPRSWGGQPNQPWTARNTPEIISYRCCALYLVVSSVVCVSASLSWRFGIPHPCPNTTTISQKEYKSDVM